MNSEIIWLQIFPSHVYRKADARFMSGDYDHLAVCNFKTKLVQLLFFCGILTF